MNALLRQFVHAEPRTRTLGLWIVAAVLFALLTLLSPAALGGDGTPDSNPSVDLAQIEKAFERVVEQAAPSVVGIRVQRRYETTVAGEAASLDGAFEQLITVNGSGTIIDSDGLILTNEHVVQAARNIEVFFHDGVVARADVLASDPRGDLAVLKANRGDLTPARWVDWRTVARAQWAIAIGNPYGLGDDGKQSVSVGVISNLDRKLPGLGEVDDRLYTDLMQTTAAIHPGCSGGPLFNIHGELIGVVTAMHTRAPADEGVGFAIPMSPGRRRAIAELSQGRPVEYGYLGLTVRSIRPTDPVAVRLGDGVGVIIEKVDPIGPAADADLRVGDAVLRYDGELVRGPSLLADLVGQTAPGSTVKIDLRRGDQSLTPEITIRRREVSQVGWMRGDAILWRGMRLANLTPHIRDRMGVSDGVLGVVVVDIATAGGSPRAGVSVGDVIESVEGRPVRDITQLNAGVRDCDGVVKMVIRGRGEILVQP